MSFLHRLSSSHELIVFECLLVGKSRAACVDSLDVSLRFCRSGVRPLDFELRFAHTHTKLAYCCPSVVPRGPTEHEARPLFLLEEQRLIFLVIPRE